MKISKQARRDAKGLFRAAQVNGVLDDAKARQVVDLLLESKPRGYAGILNHFQRLLKLDIDRRLARVESATALPDDIRASVAANLARLHGPGLNLVFVENRDLLGGMRVQVGSDVYDGSVRHRLNQLEESF